MATKKRRLTTEDPIVAEVRATREKLSARFGHDVASMLRDAQKKQMLSGRRVLSLTEP